jgi:hypothetical protein
MVETPDINVKSYANIAFDGAWKSRSRAIWGIAFLGLIAGAAVGLLAPFFPLLAVESMTFGAAAANILPSMAIFGATGMATGFLVGGLTGASAGAASSVAKELETRTLQREKALEQSIGIFIPNPEPEKPKAEQRYFNPKISATFAVLGAIAGKIMAAGFIAMHAGGAVTAATVSNAAIPALTVILGTAVANPLAITACFIGVMTCFGAIFGVNFPKIGGYLQDLAGRLLGGELLGTSWEKEPTKQQEKAQTLNLAKSEPPVLPYPSYNNEPTTNHAEKFAKNKVISYKEFITSPNAEASPAINIR